LPQGAPVLACHCKHDNLISEGSPVGRHPHLLENLEEKKHKGVQQQGIKMYEFSLVQV
jgi:hypothetical protein